MNEIKCPKCGTMFQINETDYESIVKQIRNKEFEKEIEQRDNQYKIDKENAVKIAEANIEKQLIEKINQKELEIKELKNQIQIKETQKELEISKAITEKENVITSLNNKLELNQKEYLLKEQNIKESYEEKIKTKDEQISYYKDFKAKQSTKMIGESLEQHCNNEFNKLRPLFKNAYFEKDNDIKTGSKGDFIFRDYDDDGTEIVSIMFEMKNEMDTTATKHKNEDFFKELDKDRNEKNCEYAVLVSLLEADSELYNAGIVDVSYKYQKMYVVRPQCFIPMITLLRNAAMNALMYKQELAEVRNQDIDISNFEDSLLQFKNDFSRNYEIAHNHFDKAIDEIDKTIQHLEKVKKELMGSDNQLRIANNKVDEVSVKKLTKDNPTMRAKFEELKTGE